VNSVEINENDLMERLANDDVSAWSELVNRYSKLVFSIAYQILRNKNDAEDAVQNTFVRLKLYANKFDSSQPLNPWLARIAGGEAIRIYNQNKNNQKKESARMDNKKDSIQSQRRGLLDEVEHEEMKSMVKKAIDMLPDGSRVALTLYYAGGLSQTEIANEMGVSQVSISAKIKSGLEKVKDYLKKSGFQASIALAPHLMQECFISVRPSKEFVVQLAQQLPTQNQLKVVSSTLNTTSSFGHSRYLHKGILYFLCISIGLLVWFYFQQNNKIQQKPEPKIALNPIQLETKKTFHPLDILNHEPFYMAEGKIQKEIGRPDVLVDGLINHRGGDGKWIMRKNKSDGFDIVREVINKDKLAGMYIEKRFNGPTLFKGVIRFSQQKSEFCLMIGTLINTDESVTSMASEKKGFIYDVNGRYNKIGSVGAEHDSVVSFEIYVWKDENKWHTATFFIANDLPGKHFRSSSLTHINKPFQFGFYSNCKVVCENFTYCELPVNWQPFSEPEIQKVKDKFPKDFFAQKDQ